MIPHPPLHTHRGTSLLEVLVAAGLMSTILALVTGLALHGQELNRDTSIRSAAVSSIDHLAARISHEIAYADSESIRMGVYDDLQLLPRDDYEHLPGTSVPDIGGFRMDAPGGGVRFVDYRAISYLPSRQSTTRKTIWWEPTETRDGIDNDGDGLVDEGRILAGYHSVPGQPDSITPLLNGVTHFGIYRELRAPDGSPYPTTRLVLDIGVTRKLEPGRPPVEFRRRTIAYLRGRWIK